MNIKEMVIAVGSLHDGTITAIEQETGILTLRVEIGYLARMIDPSYSHFIYKFVNLREFYYEAWDMGKAEQERDIAKLVSMELEINEVIQEEDCIKIVCLCDLPNNSGGHLYIRADDLNVYDEVHNNLSFEELHRITLAYWHKLS
ncbi:hypothetical protein R70723_03540 [Paenibacillus sp. FSL R7-0273]|uniref:hypothetical protein n=1 Tax=Paenibacillus sp. FSL R7-0273 TaxID=1536772 RepID=UPI0004F79721|nr:hypothetical protein [Paenibacillus sp. FSL R7-0273]AIQ45080.1 hypothetical protein R70723_03540 [Paenibacillus sp. FSL R7-0273]OMF84605.1 hypothetical protein BK144_29630 [Paenibacillus sp. FSL R7-0273]